MVSNQNSLVLLVYTMISKLRLEIGRWLCELGSPAPTEKVGWEEGDIERNYKNVLF